MSRSPQNKGRGSSTLRIALLSFMLLALIASNMVDARKSFLVKQQHPAVYAPRVQAYDTSFKIFDINMNKGKERYRMVIDNQI